MMDYADITYFLKGNATLPPNDENETETSMQKKNIQGRDKECTVRLTCS